MRFQSKKHHIIDILEPWENFNVSDFHDKVKPLISQLPVFCFHGIGPDSASAGHECLPYNH